MKISQKFKFSLDKKGSLYIMKIKILYFEIVESQKGALYMQEVVKGQLSFFIYIPLYLHICPVASPKLI